MALTQSSMNRSTRARPESADPFAMQLALSRVHARLVPMERSEHGYALDPSAQYWFELPAERGFAGYGLGRALRMLLDVLRGLTALHDTFDAEGVDFAHGEVALTQLRLDGEGVCRLVPLTARHSAPESRPSVEALGYLAPERLLGEPVDARADVFSAGVLLWEALAGRRLFNETVDDVIIDRLMGEKLQVPQLPPELAWAIPLKSIAARALSVDPHQRFADCAELATAIAIVARDRVATHTEIAAFFGPQLRSHGSVAQPRPVPSRSSTFPSVSTPATSISAPPSSRNGFPLAMPAVRSVTPLPRSVAPTPITPVPNSVAPAPHSVTPVPRAATLPPPSVRPPETQRNAVHKSHFATLIGTGEVVPASHKRKTLTGLGTPKAALAPSEPVPASAEPTSKLPPALPVWGTVANAAPRSTPAPTSSSAIVVRRTLESISLSEVAQFRTWSARRSLIAAGVVAAVGLVIALVASLGSNDDPKVDASSAQIQLPKPAVSPISAPAPQAVAPAEDPASSAPASRSAAEPGSGAPSAPKELLRPATKAAAATTPVKPAPVNTKDYGI